MLSSTSKKKINTKGIDPIGKYIWVVVEGHSMTDGTKRSIPHGCMVLGRMLEFKHEYELVVVLHRPALFFGRTKGVEWCLVKSLSFLDFAAGFIRLTSYNPAFKDQWFSIDDIQQVYLIEQVRIKKSNRWITESVLEAELSKI